jgi:hypothetical protein
VAHHVTTTHNQVTTNGLKQHQSAKSEGTNILGYVVLSISWNVALDKKAL